MLSYWSQMKLWKKVMIGMVLGIMFGYFFGEEAIVLKPIGQLFINALKMIVVPLVFFSILYGVTSISDASTFGRVGSKALITYTITTVFAVCIGLSFANYFEPGLGLNIDIEHSSNASNSKSLGEILMQIIPTNPVQAMAEGNTIQVVVFAFFTGFSLILIGDKGREAREVIVSITHVVFKMIELVIKLTPYGVFCIMAWVVGQFGFNVLISLSKFVMTVVLALGLQYVLFGFMLFFMARLNPFPFYRKMTDTQALAFATVSSKATLPTAMKELQLKLGVSKQSSTFILPLGASMNMDGVAIYLGICTVFFAQLFGIELTLSQYLVVILTSTIGSIGAAGFPGGSMVMMGMVLSSVGIPLEGISIILGVDRILEMLRTLINITGDCTVTVIVDAWEKHLNREVYYSKLEDADEEDSA